MIGYAFLLSQVRLRMPPLCPTAQIQRIEAIVADCFGRALGHNEKGDGA